jgi:hypothetical protein
MPIRRFIAGRAFEPEAIRCMSIAFERVCGALGLRIQDDPATRLVAEKVIEVAQRGITDTSTIFQMVLKEFEQMSEATRLYLAACRGQV